MADYRRIVNHPALGAAPVGGALAFTFDGHSIEGRAGDTIASALWAAGRRTLGRAADGQARGLACGTGHCFACRVTVDGVAEVRACLVHIRAGMRVEPGTEEGETHRAG